MNDRLAIAAQISAGLFAGVPYGMDDFEQTEELQEAEQKTVKAIARLALMMAEELIRGDRECSNVQNRLAQTTEA